MAGHVTDVVYHANFDTAVNLFLIERGVLDIRKGEVVGFVVNSGGAYFSKSFTLIILPEDAWHTWRFDAGGILPGELAKDRARLAAR